VQQDSGFQLCLAGLENIESLTHLIIRGNDDLINFDGLNNLRNIQKDFKVIDNFNITDFTGLGKLESIGDYFEIEHNVHLNDFNGLEKLGEASHLIIENNTYLHSLKGLGNINSESIDVLSIQKNYHLTECGVKSICEFFNNGLTIHEDVNGVTSQSHMHRLKAIAGRNLSGCDNIFEIQNSCSKEFELRIFPNPAYENVTFEYFIPELSFVKFEIFDHLGRLIAMLVNKNQIGFHKIIWDLNENIPKGFYFFQITSGYENKSGQILRI
jgi:hypothetical protein